MKALVHIVICLSILCISVCSVNAELVAHWTFDEGTGAVANDSAGSNNGTILGATWTSGASGGALSFNAANHAYVDVHDSAALRFSQSSSFTISMWANVSTGFMLLSKMRGAGQSGVFGYQLDYWGGTTNAFNFSLESSCVGSTHIQTGVGSAFAGTWYYVTAVYDNKSMKLYLNGDLKNSGSFGYNTGTTTPDGDLAIGARELDGGPQAGWYFGGALDDVRIYNEALSGSAIMNLYQTTPEPCTMVLLGLGGVWLRRRRQA